MDTPAWKVQSMLKDTLSDPTASEASISTRLLSLVGAETTLRVHDTKVSTNGAQALADLLQRDLIKSLTLSAVVATKSAWRQIAVGVQACPSLEALSLRMLRLGETGWKSMAAAIQFNPKLITVDVSQILFYDSTALCDDEDGSVEAALVAGAWRSLARSAADSQAGISTLTLQYLDVNPEGWGAFIDSFASNRTLLHLDVSGLDIDHAGWEAMIAALRAAGPALSLLTVKGASLPDYDPELPPGVASVNVEADGNPQVLDYYAGRGVHGVALASALPDFTADGRGGSDGDRTLEFTQVFDEERDELTISHPLKNALNRVLPHEQVDQCAEALDGVNRLVVPAIAIPPSGWTAFGMVMREQATVHTLHFHRMTIPDFDGEFRKGKVIAVSQNLLTHTTMYDVEYPGAVDLCLPESHVRARSGKNDAAPPGGVSPYALAADVGPQGTFPRMSAAEVCDDKGNLDGVVFEVRLSEEGAPKAAVIPLSQLPTVLSLLEGPVTLPVTHESVMLTAMKAWLPSAPASLPTTAAEASTGAGKDVPAVSSVEDVFKLLGMATAASATPATDPSPAGDEPKKEREEGAEVVVEEEGCKPEEVEPEMPPVLREIMNPAPFKQLLRASRAISTAAAANPKAGNPFAGPKDVSVGFVLCCMLAKMPEAKTRVVATWIDSATPGGIKSLFTKSLPSDSRLTALGNRLPGHDVVDTTVQVANLLGGFIPAVQNTAKAFLKAAATGGGDRLSLHAPVWGMYRGSWRAGVMSPLCHNTTLRTLVLDHVTVSPFGASSAHAVLSDNAAASLASLLQHNTTLTDLHIRDTSLTPAGWASIAAALRNAPNSALKELTGANLGEYDKDLPRSVARAADGNYTLLRHYAEHRPSPPTPPPFDFLLQQGPVDMEEPPAPPAAEPPATAARAPTTAAGAGASSGARRKPSQDPLANGCWSLLDK